MKHEDDDMKIVGKNATSNNQNDNFVNPVTRGLAIFFKGFGVFIRVLTAVVIIGVCLAIGLGIGIVSACLSSTDPLTDDDLRVSSLSTYLYYDDGSVITYTNSDGDEVPLAIKGTENQNRELVDIESVPKNLQNAFVAIEDERFFTHSGVDIKRTVAAVAAYVIPGLGSFGGSTITQQLVKNATGDDASSIPRKIREAWRAYLLEQNYTKTEILEDYMNIIYFGRDLYGVQAASKAYFNKEVSDLSLAECAYLAGITNSPGKYAPFTTSGRINGYKRQIKILDKMLELEMITTDEYVEAIQEELVFYDGYRTKNSEVLYSYFVDYTIMQVKEDLIASGYTEAQATKLIYGGGLKIYTTQSKSMQDAMDAEYLDESNFPNNTKYLYRKQMAQSAMVIMDQYTGQLKAMYGAYGKKLSNLAYNYATDGQRQPGSSIKAPLIYGPLIDSHIVTTATTIEDELVFLDESNPKTPWPRNSYNGFFGEVTLRFALLESCNVPAVKLYKENIDLCLSYLKSSGIDFTEETGLSTALGGVSTGVSVLQMCSAYVPFANGQGIYYEPTCYTKVLDSQGQILLEEHAESHLVYQDAGTAAVMTSMLQSVVTGGTGTRVRMYKEDGTYIPVAGKTGTTNSDYDRWFIGYTSYYTCAVWYGYPSQKTLDVEELRAGMNMWREVMLAIHKDLPVKDFEVAQATKTVAICSKSRMLADENCINCGCLTYEEFIPGTEPTAYCTDHHDYELCTDITATYMDPWAGVYTEKYYIATEWCEHTTTKMGSSKDFWTEPCFICYYKKFGTYPDTHTLTKEEQTAEDLKETLKAEWEPLQEEAERLRGIANEALTAAEAATGTSKYASLYRIYLSRNQDANKAEAKANAAKKLYDDAVEAALELAIYDADHPKDKNVFVPEEDEKDSEDKDD